MLGYKRNGDAFTVNDLGIAGAITVLMKDAIHPNLVQTTENTPAFIHGGPFANIAHGCNSVTATKMAVKISDYALTEAGFGADLGAEKFIDIKCRNSGLEPSAVVIVATIRALKMHGGVPKMELAAENIQALEKGIPNLLRHVSSIKDVYSLPYVVAINRFPTDTDAEIELLINKCAELGIKAVPSTVWHDGGNGALELAQEVINLCQHESHLNFAYDINAPVRDKVNQVIRKIYRGNGAEFSPEAKKQIAQLEKLGLDKLPVCIAKTQYSFSDDASKMGAPENFDITVKKIKVSAGAGFIVVLTGSIMTMPGLPKVPASAKIDVDENGIISGLF